ncbi:MAG: response regulator [Candidatus Saccharibacteria bacterium]
MPKIILVEDDNNLREIYEARLAAEGYEIISAHDGEEALALAIKEKPDLIIADVMMPKISGFDMLDILRSTPEIKDTKVIIMTALSQAEDRERADKLGADRYLIKSQVTLEDVIKVAHEVLNDLPATATAPEAVGPTAAGDPTPAVTAPEPVEEATPAEPPTLVSPPTDEPATKDEPSNSDDPISTDEPATKDDTPAVTTIPEEAPTAAFVSPTASAPQVSDAPYVPEVPEVPKANPEVSTPGVGTDLSQTKSDETDGVEKQIQDFIANNPTLTTSTEMAKPEAEPTGPATDAPDQIAEPAPVAEPVVEPITPNPIDSLKNPTPANATSINEAPSHKKLVLEPTDSSITQPVDLNALLEKESQKEISDQPVPTPATDSVISPSDNAL